MTEKHTAIVVTTIFEPRFLEGYLANLDRGGRRETAEILVITDRKTPSGVHEACRAAVERGFRVECPSLEGQEAFLSGFPSMRDRIPYDSDNRRNVGFLMALARGAEVVISIDDDNFCPDEVDFVGEHGVVGERALIEPVTSDDGWFNVGTRLTTSERSGELYPRGFPYFSRKRSRVVRVSEPREARVALNAGLWRSDPDVDALTRIVVAPVISDVNAAPVFLSDKTWSPINSQNTAIARDAMAAYYYVRMGYPLGGLQIDRFGDILSGYFCQKCVKVRGDAVRVGSPVTDHRRTPHNLFKDLYHELAGIVLIEGLLPWLVEVRLSGSSYVELYADLATVLEEAASTFHGFIWDDGGRDFIRSTAANMRAWLEAVRTIG